MDYHGVQRTRRFHVCRPFDSSQFIRSLYARDNSRAIEECAARDGAAHTRHRHVPCGHRWFGAEWLLPVIAHDLDVSEATAGQLATVFALTYAIASPLVAALTGNWDRRGLLIGGMALFTVGMVGQAIGTSFLLMAVARAIAALGAAAFQSNAYVVAGAVATDEHRGRALATVAAGMTVSIVIGVPIGVWVAQLLGWRMVMWVLAAAGTLLALAVTILPAVHVPPAGLRTRLSVALRPAVAKALVITVLGVLAGFTVFVYLPLIVAPSATGTALSWVLAAYGVGQVVGNVLTGRWIDRYGPGRIRLVSLAGFAVTLAVMDVAVRSLAGAVLIELIAGVFASMLMVPQQHRLFSAAPDVPIVAVGLNGSAIYFGGALGSAMGGVVLTTAGVHWLATAGALAAVVGFVLAWVTRAPHPAHDAVTTG